MDNRPDIDYEDTNMQFIKGDDPCIVCLHDASINRTVSPNEWYWDFGDKVTYCGFKLPGDNKLVPSGDDPRFGSHKVELLQSMLNVIGNNNFSMYPSRPTSYGTTSNDTVHYTGIYLQKSNVNSLAEEHNSGSYREAGSYKEPVKKTTINVPAESCGKTRKTADKYTHSTCGGQDTWGNGVYHIYKGAGVYPVYMSSWTRAGEDYSIVNRAGTTPMENENVPEDARLVNYGVVVVKPRCPCFYDFTPVTGANTELRCIGITNPNYSCRDENTTIADVTGYLEPVGGEDGLISAYAPFMRVGVNGKVVPMSFPIDKIYWDWCDWFTDFSDADTVTDVELTGDARGWDGHWLGTEQSFISISGSHIYTIPGLYSLYFDYEYLTANNKYDHNYSDIASAIEMLSMFIDEDCADIPALQDRFMLVEIPPRFTGSISVGDRTENEKGTELTIDGITVKDVLRAGSYPIERIDWDFGDGTPIFTLYKNDYIDSLSASVVWDFSDESTSGTHFPEGSTFTFLNGCSADRVFEPFVEDYSLRHTYYRTNVDTGYMYTISCTAYAENTHTSTSASIVIKGFDNPYPSFDKVEGEVRVVDTRNYGGPDDTIIVFNSSNSGELYHVKVEDR